MKNYIWGLIFCLTPIGAIAQDAVVNTDSKKVEATAADVQWPPGVATDQNPFKKNLRPKQVAGLYCFARTKTCLMS
ncbi:hypothetical protein [Paludibacterium denitrificans]|uniref:Uncharacterized protein n=1 Tax=Paludibacterium denitrificans TaxID=2675226 RepID=A0A844GCE3_9NEIS|nr:hypothetical protein [Paludibacterium denitrificans]MTD33412.1 hypothetical protein [Paludibacterium denitrificans]